jgi:AmiR/NasT family two-component response regulator
MAKRAQVWKAMGLINVHLQLTTPDALALLRARAYATDCLVDDLAHDIITRKIPLDELRP